MKKNILILSLIVFFQTFSQKLTGTQLLEKAIAYHDPTNNWQTFNGEFFVTMKTPNRPERKSYIKINLLKE